MRLSNALVHFGRAFWLAWMVKGGAGLLPELVKYCKSLASDATYSPRREKFLGIVFGKGTVRSALAIAAFFSISKSLDHALAALPNGSRAGVSGVIASLAFSALEPDSDTRWSWAQYLSVRAGMAIGRSIIGSDRKYRDLTTAAFALGVGQLMYGFIVRPELMDAGYEAYLRSVALADSKQISAFRRERGDPCVHTHPSATCTERIAAVYGHVFKLSLPLYLSIYMLSPLLSPGRKGPDFKESLVSALRSAGFVAATVSSYQVLLCLQGALLRRGYTVFGHKHVFYLMGVMSSSAIFLERPEKRPELAAYVPPIVVC